MSAEDLGSMEVLLSEPVLGKAALRGRVVVTGSWLALTGGIKGVSRLDYVGTPSAWETLDVDRLILSSEVVRYAVPIVES